ncbi:MAG: hypothetical protein ACRCYD_11405 [Plesiomonas sp.]
MQIPWQAAVTALMLYSLNLFTPVYAASLDFKGTLATPFFGHARGSAFSATLFYDQNAPSFETTEEKDHWQQENYPFQQVSIVIDDQLYQVGAVDPSSMDNRIRLTHCEVASTTCVYDEISVHANGEANGTLDAPRIQLILRGNAGWLTNAKLPDAMRLRELLASANQASMTLQSNLASSSLRIQR